MSALAEEGFPVLALLAATMIAVLAAGLRPSRRLPALPRLLAAAGLLAALASFSGPWVPLFAAGALAMLCLLRTTGELPCALIVASVLGMAVIAQARHLFGLFLGLELASLPLYLLLHRLGRQRRALEAALKYFFCGSLAAGLYLMGMALRYSESGTFALEAAPAALGPASQLGFLLMGLAALFKLGAFPLHFWLPDAYEAAPPELAAFMSTSVKTAAALLLLVLVGAAGPESLLAWILPAAAALTMTAANLLALRQESLSRLLAYSSMSHAGFLIALLAALPEAGDRAAAAAWLYLLVYFFQNTGAWLVPRLLGLTRLADLRGLSARRPALAAFWGLMILSLAGVPPTGGFFVKLLVLAAALRHGRTGLALAVAFNSLLALGVYFRLLRTAFLESAAAAAPEAAPQEPLASARLAPALACLCAAGVLWAGLWAPLSVGLEAWLK